MSFAEMLSWRTFDALHPMPDRLPDIHHGILMSAIVNMQRDPKSMPATAADFFVFRERFAEPELEDQGLSEAERLQRIWQGSD